MPHEEVPHKVKCEIKFTNQADFNFITKNIIEQSNERLNRSNISFISEVNRSNNWLKEVVSLTIKNK